MNAFESVVDIGLVCLPRFAAELFPQLFPERRRGYGCAQHPVAKTKEIYRVRFLLRQEDLNMWVTAFADVAELIMGVSVEEFSAFNDEERKITAWGIQGTKCNMTIAKTVDEMYTNYTVESMQFAEYLP